MTRKKAGRRAQRGFTLIELLVVVLIIGILAAMAIPQYFKVVEKARVTEARNFIAVVRSAQERYMARNSRYSEDIGVMDISFSNKDGSKCALNKDCGMKAYEFKGITKIDSCPTSLNPGFKLSLGRVDDVPTYGKYVVVYNRCKDQVEYEQCKTADACMNDLE